MWPTQIETNFPSAALAGGLPLRVARAVVAEVGVRDRRRVPVPDAQHLGAALADPLVQFEERRESGMFISTWSIEYSVRTLKNLTCTL